MARNRRRTRKSQSIATSIRKILVFVIVVSSGVGCAVMGAGLDELRGGETKGHERTNFRNRNPRRRRRYDTKTPQIDGKEEVRLIGIDTSERYASGGPEPFSAEVSDLARENLGGEEIVMESDKETTDDYGRLLAYIYASDEMFNERAVSEGYAQVATFPPDTRCLGRFEAAQEEARAAKAGIWGLPEDEACALGDRGNAIGGGCRKDQGVRGFRVGSGTLF